jgi:hypothetical protein
LKVDLISEAMLLVLREEIQPLRRSTHRPPTTHLQEIFHIALPFGYFLASCACHCIVKHQIVYWWINYQCVELIKGFVCNDSYRVESNNTNFIHNKSIKPPAYIKQPGTALEMTWTTLHVEVATLVGTVTPESWCHVPPSVVSVMQCLQERDKRVICKFT